MVNRYIGALAAFGAGPFRHCRHSPLGRLRRRQRGAEQPLRAAAADAGGHCRSSPRRSRFTPGHRRPLTISGGVPPYRAFTSDATILPGLDQHFRQHPGARRKQRDGVHDLTVTVQDSGGSSPATVDVTVRPGAAACVADTVTGNTTPGCDTTDNTVCSGATGNARVKVTGNGGAGIVGRAGSLRRRAGHVPVRLDQPRPAAGADADRQHRRQRRRASRCSTCPPNTPTQSGIIRATDVTTGQAVTGTFLIQQIATDGAVLAVLPQGNTTITGPGQHALLVRRQRHQLHLRRNAALHDRGQLSRRP